MTTSHPHLFNLKTGHSGLGFYTTSRDAARILEVRRAGVCNCSVLKDSITAKMESIKLRIDELAAMKDELARLLSSWQDCGGSKLHR